MLDTTETGGQCCRSPSKDPPVPGSAAPPPSTPPAQTVTTTDTTDTANNRSSGDLQVVLLGTGTPNPDPNRMGPATAVVNGDRCWIIDAGAGVVRRAAQAAAAGVEALAPARLNRLLVTHLHSDHVVGLADLWLTPWVVGRADPLQVHGPTGTTRLVNGLRDAHAADVAVRQDGFEPANTTGHRIESTEVTPGDVMHEHNVRIEPFAVAHGQVKNALGWKLSTPDTTVVVSGDTAPCDELVRQATGADILVHEVYAGDRLSQRPAQWQRYHRAFHTSGEQLGMIAAHANPKLVVLTHLLLWGGDPQDLVDEVHRHWDGPVVVGADLDVH